MREQTFDTQRAGSGRGPAADHRVSGVARMAAGGVEHRPADRWVGKFVAALPGVIDEAGQRLELDGVGCLIVRAPAELPGELVLRLVACRRVATVDEFECVGQFVDRGLAAEGEAEQAIDAADSDAAALRNCWSERSGGSP